jgi:CheY-like chemotaxis protein
VADEWPGSGILRAIVEYENRTEIRCAVDLDGRSVFVLTETAPPLGTKVALQLSFPGLIEPVTVSGRAAQVKVMNSPGAPCGFVCELDVESHATRESLAAIRARLARAPTNPSRRLHVLLVEDSRLIRDMFGYAVEKFFSQRTGSVSIEGAHDVSAAWDKLRSTDYDLVLVDYFLPNDVDGAALIKNIRANARLSKLPVVALSVGGPSARSATLAAGADLFLDKPIVLKDLFRTFELMMARKDDDARAP